MYTRLLISYTLFAVATAIITVPGIYINGTIQPPDFEFVAPSAQVTPVGFNWPLFEPVTGPLMLNVSGGIPCEALNGMIVLTIGNNVDREVLFYRECGAIGIIFMATSPGRPGGSIVQLTQEVMTRDNVFPIADIEMTLFPELAAFFANITVASNFSRVLLVTMTATERDNWYKNLAYSPEWFIFILVMGLSSVVYLVLCTIYMTRLVQGILAHVIDREEAKPTLISGSLLIMGSIWAILGLINYAGYMQAMPYVASSFLTFSHVGWHFAAVLFMCWMFLNILDKTGGINVKIMGPRYAWPYAALAVVLVANDWIFAPLSAGLKSDRPTSLAIVLIWMIVTIVITMGIAIFFVTTFGMIVAEKRKSERAYNKATTRLMGFITRNLVIAGSIVCYSVITICGLFFVYTSSEYLVFSYYGHEGLLRVIAGCVMFNIYKRTQQLVKKSKSDKSPTVSKSTELKTSNTNSRNSQIKSDTSV